MARFGAKLRKLRENRGYTLRELGAMLGVHHTHVSQLETSRKVPNAAMILKIADLFGVTTDVLMRDELELDLNTDNQNQQGTGQ